MLPFLACVIVQYSALQHMATAQCQSKIVLGTGQLLDLVGGLIVHYLVMSQTVVIDYLGEGFFQTRCATRDTDVGSIASVVEN